MPRFVQLSEAISDEKWEIVGIRFGFAGQLSRDFRNLKTRVHAHPIAVVAEGSRYHADVFSNYIATSSKHAGIELRVTKLGHVQRGGAPGVADRLLASQLGVAACDCFAHGEHGVLVGVVGGKVIKTALATVVNSSKRLDSQLTNLYAELAN